jgi:hypothetical protein
VCVAVHREMGIAQCANRELVRESASRLEIKIEVGVNYDEKKLLDPTSRCSSLLHLFDTDRLQDGRREVGVGVASVEEGEKEGGHEPL